MTDIKIWEDGDVVWAEWAGGKMAAVSFGSSNPLSEGSYVAVGFTTPPEWVCDSGFELSRSLRIPPELRVVGGDFRSHYQHLLDLRDKTAQKQKRIALPGIVTSENYPLSKYFTRGTSSLPKSMAPEAPKTRGDMYPHVCPYCGEAAYVGLGSVDCSENCGGR